MLWRFDKKQKFLALLTSVIPGPLSWAYGVVEIFLVAAMVALSVVHFVRWRATVSYCRTWLRRVL